MQKLKTSSPQRFQRLSELLQEKNRRTLLYPAKEYVPNGKAEEFIKMVGEDKKFVSIFCAANGVGKSCSLANIITNICFGVQSDYFKYPLFEKWPYMKRGRIISDPTTIKSKIIPELEKWFPVNESTKMPEANFEMGKEGKNYVCKIKTNTGWEIDLMSTEQDAKEFESTDIGFAVVDEPMPKDKFMATIARLRTGGVVIMGFTPLFFAAWLKEWMDEHCDGSYADYVEAEVEDNCIVHGVRGILKHSDIKRMVDAMPEDEKEARAFGKFGHLLGRVHKLFRRKVHVIKPFSIDERKFAVYKAIDPHPRTADHVLYMAVDSKGTKYITGEVISEGSTELLAERMKSHETAMHYRIEGRIIDPSAFNTDQHKGDPSVGDMLYNITGEVYAGGSKDLMACIKRTNDALDYQMINERMVRPPELYIFDTCTVTIKQLDEYVWAEWKGAAKDTKQLNARPLDRNDHNVENLHRLLLNNSVFVPYQMSSQAQSGPSWADEIAALDPYGRR